MGTSSRGQLRPTRDRGPAEERVWSGPENNGGQSESRSTKRASLLNLRKFPAFSLTWVKPYASAFREFTRKARSVEPKVLLSLSVTAVTATNAIG